jgi:antitoxin HigA-1
MRMFNPPHPGRVLKDAIGELSIRVAHHLGISRERLTRILSGRSPINADMALRLSEALGTSVEVWTGMQSQYDPWQAFKKRRRKIARLRAA